MEQTKPLSEPTQANTQNQRNYELDFLKLSMAIVIFVYHMRAYYPSDDPRRTFLNHYGSFVVHFFFVVSGMLMANSIMKQNVTEDFGKASISFIIKKFKSMGWSVLTATGLYFIGWTIIGFHSGSLKTLEDFATAFVRQIPEAMLLSQAGFDIYYISLTWYISAMFIVMLPLSYMMYKNRSFFLYVFSPLAATLSLGYMCQTNSKYQFFSYTRLSGFVTGGVWRALCGICFGVCAYTICAKLKEKNFGRAARVRMTLLEVVLYCIYVWSSFVSTDSSVHMCGLLILPIALAITFSGQSYFGTLFRFKWMKVFGTLSLEIYLNHLIARYIVRKYYNTGDYWSKFFKTVAITAGVCILSWCIRTFLKFIVRKIKAKSAS